MFLLGSKQGYMTYNHFTQIPGNQMTTANKKMSSVSPQNSSKYSWNCSCFSSVENYRIRNKSDNTKKNSSGVSIFDSPERRTFPKKCFKKTPKTKFEVKKDKIEFIREEGSSQIQNTKNDDFKVVCNHKKEFKRKGFGVQIFREGSKFKGCFKEDSANGAGEFLYNNGTKVIGHWKNNKLQKGSIIYESGAKFKGEFQDLEHAKGKISGDCFKKGKFTFTDGKYFDATWSKKGSLIQGYIYDNLFRCYRLQRDDLPYVIYSQSNKQRGIIINRRWIYEGEIKSGRMAGKGWIYEPFNCSYIRSDMELNSLGRDFEFRYINEDVFFKKEFESSGGKIRKVRVYLPTGVIFEKNFEKKNENFGILRLMFEDLKGVFQGKVDNCEKVRAFDGNYFEDRIKIPLKIFFNKENFMIFLVKEKLLEMKDFKIFLDFARNQKKESLEKENSKETTKILFDSLDKDKLTAKEPTKVSNSASQDEEPEKQQIKNEEVLEDSSFCDLEEISNQSIEKVEQPKETLLDLTFESTQAENQSVKENQMNIKFSHEDINQTLEEGKEEIIEKEKEKEIVLDVSENEDSEIEQPSSPVNVMKLIDLELVKKINENYELFKAEYNESFESSEHSFSEQASYISDKVQSVSNQQKSSSEIIKVEIESELEDHSKSNILSDDDNNSNKDQHHLKSEENTPESVKENSNLTSNEEVNVSSNTSQKVDSIFDNSIFSDLEVSQTEKEPITSQFANLNMLTKTSTEDLGLIDSFKSQTESITINSENEKKLNDIEDNFSFEEEISEIRNIKSEFEVDLTKKKNEEEILEKEEPSNMNDSFEIL